MKKQIILHIILLLFGINSFGQSLNLEKHPPKWNNNKLSNSLSFLFPFKEQSTFSEAAIYFEKKKNSNFIILRYRVFSNYTIPKLRMKNTPTMLVKLGDGTVLTGKKERIINGILNASSVIDVYFNLNSELQNKILKHGIEKVRIAYIFSYLGMERNQIFDAFIADCEDKEIRVASFLKQIRNADINKARQRAKLNNLDYGF